MKRDEAEALEKVKEDERRIKIAEREHRLRMLRDKTGAPSDDTSIVEPELAQPAVKTSRRKKETVPWFARPYSTRPSDSAFNDPQNDTQMKRFRLDEEKKKRQDPMLGVPIPRRHSDNDHLPKDEARIEDASNKDWISRLRQERLEREIRERERANALMYGPPMPNPTSSNHRRGEYYNAQFNPDHVRRKH